MKGIPSIVALARKRVSPGLARVARGDRGGLFIETILAIAIFTIVGVAVLTGYATTQRTGAVSDRHAHAESIARNQMEYIFSQPYLPPPQTYAIDPGISIPSYFLMTATGEEVEAGVTSIQKIIVTVSWNGSPYWTLESLYNQN